MGCLVTGTVTGMFSDGMFSDWDSDLGCLMMGLFYGNQMII